MSREVFWILQKRDSDRFPYRLTIRDRGEPILSLLVQDLWPGSRGHIFCIRAEEKEGDLKAVEEIPVISLRRYGRKLSVVLDRAQRKRCDFLFLRKRYKTKPGEYEQIFWMTQGALKARRPKVLLSARGDESLEIVIDVNEKYPWRFSRCRVSRKSLPVGDYALLIDDKISAVVERKTFDNLLANFSNLPILHQQMGELEAYSYSALVIEANYQDFLSKKRLEYFNPRFAAKAIAEISAYHPGLNIVFAGTKKLANEWVLRFFSAIKYHEGNYPEQVREVIESYQGDQEFYGPEYEIRQEAVELGQFSLNDLSMRLSHISVSRLRKILAKWRKKGRVKLLRKGRKTYWRTVD